MRTRSHPTTLWAIAASDLQRSLRDPTSTSNVQRERGDDREDGVSMPPGGGGHGVAHRLTLEPSPAAIAPALTPGG
jgi:hypothetical protein